MKKLLFVAFSGLLFFTAQGQIDPIEKGRIQIIGKVIDSLSKLPVEYATLSLVTQGNKKTITGTTSDSAGQFILREVPEGNYSILVESISYTPYTHFLAITGKKAVVNLATIALVKTQGSLQNVTVVARGKLIENKIDKLVFNAERDLTSQTGVATDVLKKVPQVSVDVDGNVELAGSSSVRFLINGKPSTVFGSNIADVLQAIPASQIKSIEVITNPGARYDAQGLGGIINIVLKQTNAKGVNGSLSLAAGTRMENGSDPS